MTFVKRHCGHIAQSLYGVADVRKYWPIYQVVDLLLPASRNDCVDRLRLAQLTTFGRVCKIGTPQ